MKRQPRRIEDFTQVGLILVAMLAVTPVAALLVLARRREPRIEASGD